MKYLALLALVGTCEPVMPVVITQADNMGMTTVPVGITVEIHLDGSVTTGYKWVLQNEDPGFPLVSSEYVSHGILDSAGGTFIFIFEPYLHNIDKSYTLEFLYYQPWLGIHTATGSFTHTIEVTKP